MSFCQNCGEKLAVDGFFCHNCGQQTSGVKPDAITPATNSANSNSTSSPPASTLSFEEFKKRKEASRSSLFTTKNAKKKRVSNESNEEVKIQVGIVHIVDGEIKKLKGRTLPVTTSPGVDARALLQTAIEKHGKHFQQFNVSQKYVLLYPDYALVSTLPGSLQDFSLRKYKEDLGKSYAKVYLWLCKHSDFEAIHVDLTDSDHDGPASTEENGNLKASVQGPPNNVTNSIIPYLAATTPDPILVSDQGQRSNPVIIADNSIPNRSQDGRREEATALCPTCYRRILITIIEEHANLCADTFDPVGEISGQCIEVACDTNDREVIQVQSDSSITCTSNAEKEQKMKIIVNQLQTNIDSENKTRIRVRRKSIFHDFLAIQKKPWFTYQRLFKVIFIGEPAIDDGGPRREFFSEILQQVRQRLLPDGVPISSMTALTNNEFKVAGELMISSIAQGGPSPSILATEVYDYVVDGAASVTSDKWSSQLRPELKIIIDQISNASTDLDLQKVLMEESSLEHLSNIGYRGVPTKETISSKECLLRSLVMVELTKILPMLDQLAIGLNTFGLLETIKSNKMAMQPLFTRSECFLPNVEYMLDNLHGDFSEDGCNRKSQEIDVFKFLSDYVTDVGFLVSLDDADGVNLSTLFKFITGASSIPPLGLPNGITAKFKHQCSSGCRCRPTASTCDISITFPVHYDNYQDFKDSLSSALMEGFGFGFI